MRRASYGILIKDAKSALCQSFRTLYMLDLLFARDSSAASVEVVLQRGARWKIRYRNCRARSSTMKGVSLKHPVYKNRFAKPICEKSEGERKNEMTQYSFQLLYVIHVSRSHRKSTQFSIMAVQISSVGFVRRLLNWRRVALENCERFMRLSLPPISRLITAAAKGKIDGSESKSVQLRRWRVK